MVPGPNAITSSSFSINSHKDDVARLEGTPYRVTAPIRQTRASLQEERRSNRELGIKPDEDDEVIEDNISGLNNEDDRETWYFPGRDTIRRPKRRGSVSKKLVYATARGPMAELLAIP